MYLFFRILHSFEKKVSIDLKESNIIFWCWLPVLRHRSNLSPEHRKDTDKGTGGWMPTYGKKLRSKLMATFVWEYVAGIGRILDMKA